LIDLDGESTSAPAPQVVTNQGNPFLSPVVPSGEGTSRQKGKGPDPRNWGAADFTEEFSEADLEAQRAAFDNFEEINRVIKEEALSTPKGFLNDVPNTRTGDEKPRPKSVVSKEPSRKRGGEASGQTKSKKAAKSEKDSGNKRQSEESSKSKFKPTLNQAEQTVQESILRNMNQDDPKGSSRKPSGRGAVAHAAAGSMIQQAIRNSAQVTTPPSSEPSDSSSSSSSDDELSEASSEGSGSRRSGSSGGRKRRRSSRKSSRKSKKAKKAKRKSRGAILKPIPPQEYDGSPDAQAFYRFVRQGSAYV
jgi:hypothetical protein